MRYTNSNNLPLSAAVWLATETYDHQDDPNVISVTSLMRSTREVILSSRIEPSEQVQDVSELLPSRLGTAFHDSMESAWLSPKLPETLISLGYPKKVAEKVNVNPEKPTGGFDVYLEKRTNKPFGNWTISGQIDICIDGHLSDLKSTGTFTWINNTNESKYIEQMSIYRWLNPDIILDDRGSIIYLFKDWNKNQALSGKNYPSHPVIEQSYALMSLQETESFIKKKLNLLEQYKDKPASEIPECTQEELWQKDPTYAYYSKPDAKRAGKTFDNAIEAQRHLQDKGVGRIETRLGVPTKCLYCAARPKCDQATKFYNMGLLKIL